MAQRIVAWTASLFAHLLVLILAMGWFLRERGGAIEATAANTLAIAEDKPFEFEVDLEPRSKPKPQVISETKSPGPTPEERIAKMLNAPAPKGLGNVPPSPAPAAVAKSSLHSKLDYPGKSVVYVLDRSGSMGKGDRWPRAVEALMGSLDNLSEGMFFQIVVYNGQAETVIGSDLCEVKKRELATLRNRLLSIEREGGSRHDLALQRAMQLRPDALFLLTDADDFTEKEVKAVEGMFEKQSLNVILFGDRDNGNATPLQRLMKQRRGGVYIARPNGTLERVG